MQLLLLFLAVIPVVVILTYIYVKDKNKEPWGLLALLFFMGIVSCFMVLAISEVVHLIFPFMSKGTEHMTFFEVMAYAFIGVALVEEFCKFFMSYIWSYRSKAYDEVYDGIVYAVYVSLGFAFFENLLYVFTNQSISIGIARGLLAVPGHACDAVFMGYYLSVAKVYSYQGKKDLERKNLLLSVIVPTILHGIYDFCLFTGMTIFVILFLVFVVFMYIAAIKKIKFLAAQSKEKPKQVQNTQMQTTGFTPEPVNNNTYNQPTTYMQNNNQPSGYIQNNNSGYIQNNNTGYVQSNNNGYVQNNNGYVQNNMQPQYTGGYVNMNNNQPRYCSTCGSPVTGDFCGNCGSRQN